MSVSRLSSIFHRGTATRVLVRCLLAREYEPPTFLGFALPAMSAEVVVRRASRVVVRRPSRVARRAPSVARRASSDGDGGRPVFFSTPMSDVYVLWFYDAYVRASPRPPRAWFVFSFPTHRVEKARAGP